MVRPSAVHQGIGLAGWLLLTFVAAALGGFASVNAAGFYGQLVRPSWAPPSWLFGPVWSVLYILMGIAAWLVWRDRGFKGAATALGLYAAQLVANALWTWLFFAWHQGALAAVEVLVLLALIVATAVAFGRVSRLAALLLVPYALWVGFASLLTWSIWQNNPGLL